MLANLHYQSTGGREPRDRIRYRGTTRDAVDTEIVHNGTEYVFIDTAGLRRKSKIKEELERYSIIRTVTAVERADDGGGGD